MFAPPTAVYAHGPPKEQYCKVTFHLVKIFRLDVKRQNSGNDVRNCDTIIIMINLLQFYKKKKKKKTLQKQKL